MEINNKRISNGVKSPLSVIILTYNEELNLENCLKSVSDWADEIFIVDSYSADKTQEIAKRYGAKIIQHAFANQAKQFNWALDNLEIKSEWILRLDADEYLTEELKKEITETLNMMRTSDVPRGSTSQILAANSQEVEPRKIEEINGFYIKRRIYFMNRWIKHAGVYPLWFLRLFKKGKAKSELKEIDEHIVLFEGKAGELKNDFIHDDKKSLSDWIQKHNDYSTREVETILNLQPEIAALGGQPERKRWLKEKFYYRLPLFCRAFGYFIYRYFFCLGFLDGKQGLIYHFLRICWYRFLLDAKIYEHKKKLELKIKTRPFN